VNHDNDRMNNKSVQSASPVKANIQHDKKAFKVGILGRKSAGKTCLIAALSLPRSPHPKGIQCVQLPAKREDGDAYRLGDERLSEAKREIMNGGIPVQTDPTTLLAYRYRLLVPPCKKPFFVELLDYSGELIESGMSAGELASRLRATLQDLDALLVLAEHPRPSSDRNQLAFELNELTRIFHLIHEDKLDFPVGLVINKWDRFTVNHKGDGPSNGQLPSMETVTQFIEASAPHQALRKNLEAISGKHFGVLAVSAFGDSVIIEEMGADGTLIRREAPRFHNNQLCSFGLEDMFLWAVVQAEARHTERLQTGFRRLNRFGPLSTFLGSPRSAQQIKAMATGELLRTRRDSRFRGMQKRIKWLSSFVSGCRMATRFTLFTMAALLAVFGLEEYLVVDSQKTLASEHSSHSDKSRAEDLIEMIGKTRFPEFQKNFFPDKRLGLIDFAAQSRRDRETEEWDELRGSENDPVEAERRAKMHLSLWPNGLFQRACIDLIKKGEIVREERDWQKVTGEGDGIKRGKSATEFLVKWPNSKFVSEAGHYIKFGKEAEEKQDWQIVEEEHDAIRKGELASIFLKNRPGSQYAAKVQLYLGLAEVEKQNREWQTVVNETDPVRKGALAQEFLERFSESQYSSEANKFIGEAKRIEMEKALAQKVSAIENKISSLVAAPIHSTSDALDDVRKLEEELRELSNNSLPEDLAPRLRNEVKRLGEFEKEVKRKVVILELKNEFNEYFSESRDLFAAADLLLKIEQDGFTASFNSERSQFGDGALRILESQASEKSVNGRQWEEAENLIEKFNSSIVRNPYFSEILPSSASQEADRIRTNILKEGDRFLYENALKKNQEEKVRSLELYLKKAPVGKMRSEVEKYLNWVKKMESPHPVTLKLVAIQLSGTVKNDFVGGYDLVITVTCGGESVGKSDEIKLEETEKGKKTFKEASWQLGYKHYKDTPEFIVALEEIDLSTNDQLGNSTKRISLKDLASEDQPLEMENSSDPSQGGSKLYFRVEGYDPEPGLPEHYKN
jgi:hypothetical protein